MKRSLTPAQLIVLRRCSGGLRAWEVGADLATLLAELSVLRECKFVAFDEERGFETTPAGEAWLREFDE